MFCHPLRCAAMYSSPAPHAALHPEPAHPSRLGGSKYQSVKPMETLLHRHPLQRHRAGLFSAFAVQFSSRHIRFTLLALLPAAFLPTFSSAQSSATGTIEGRVFNAATGNSLVNARVSLEGTSR